MKKFLHLIFITLLLPEILPAQLVPPQEGDRKQVIYLWPGGAPGFESRKDEPEQAKDWWVKNIHPPFFDSLSAAKR